MILKWPWTVVTVALVICAAIGVALALVDFRCRRLPHLMTAALYSTCGLAFVVAAVEHANWSPIGRSALGAGIALVAFLALAMMFPGQLGLGDVRRRLLVRPGMTGLWQVSGRSDLSWDEAVRLDLYYVDNWSLAQDVSILARTFGAVTSARGAY